MKKYLNKKIITIILITFIILLQSKVFATGGQASGTSSSYSKTVSYFFELARAMETATGTLGKESNINTQTNYLDTSANGIDCHLEKNTEYGTLSLLAASDYGNKTSTDSAGTANNGTGVYQMNNGKYEYVANTLYVNANDASPKSTDYNKALTRADSRYVNQYKGTTKYSIPGDGIIETDGWGGSTYFVTSSNPVFARSLNGFFGYYYYGSGNSDSNCGARAVVVCGSGL